MSLKMSIPRSQVERIIDGDDESKKYSRPSIDVQLNEFSLTKQEIKPGMNGLGKVLWKVKAKLMHVSKKTLARKRIFVQTPIYYSTLKLEQKHFTPQNHSLFRSISCFGVTRITTPIWLQKSWKCVNIS